MKATRGRRRNWGEPSPPLLRSVATLASILVAPDFSFAAAAVLFLRNHCDLDRLGHYWRVVRYMVGVAEEQLKRVLAQRKVNCCFGLARSEMQMIEVIRYRLIQRRQLGVDQEMVVAGVGLFDARRRHAHVGKTKMNGRLL